MRSLPNENRTELRARYAELLRLREHVERLENLRQEKPVSDGTMEGVAGSKTLSISAITKYASNAGRQTV